MCLLMLTQKGALLDPLPLTHSHAHTGSRPCWVTIVPGCGRCLVWGRMGVGGIQEPESFQLHFLPPSLRAPTQRSCCCGISGAPEEPLVRRRRRYHKEGGRRRRVSNSHLIYLAFILIATRLGSVSAVSPSPPRHLLQVRLRP